MYSLILITFIQAGLTVTPHSQKVLATNLTYETCQKMQKAQVVGPVANPIAPFHALAWTNVVCKPAT